MKLDQIPTKLNKCVDNFTNKMTPKVQLKTVAKVAAVAALAGLLAFAIVCPLGGVGLGVALGVTVAAVVSIGAFGYFTHDYGLMQGGKDMAKEAVKGLKNDASNTFNEVRNFVNKRV